MKVSTCALFFAIRVMVDYQEQPGNLDNKEFQYGHSAYSNYNIKNCTETVLVHSFITGFLKVKKKKSFSPQLLQVNIGLEFIINLNLHFPSFSKTAKSKHN